MDVHKVLEFMLVIQVMGKGFLCLSKNQIVLRNVFMKRPPNGGKEVQRLSNHDKVCFV